MTRLCAWFVMAVALVPMVACSSDRGPSDNPPLVDAAPKPDSLPRPDPQPLRACEAAPEAIDLGVEEAIERESFYASAFYFRTRMGIHRKRLGGTTQTLLRNGQLYPRLGEAATLQVRPVQHEFEFRAPGGGFDCGPSVQIPLSLEYRTNRAGSFGGEVVVLLDDLTQDLTHVLATGETYDGEVVTEVSVESQYGACGRMVLQMELASGRRLLVLRDPQAPKLETLLTVAAPNEPPGGQPIEGAPDRFLGLWNSGSLERDQLTFYVTVNNAAKQYLGTMLGSLDLSSKKITCRITDTDVPCATRRPGAGTSQNPWRWDQDGDTAASTDSVITVVRGGSVVQEIGAGFGVFVCKTTGEIFFPRQFSPLGFENSAVEVYALRRSGAIQRVTRNVELTLGGSLRAMVFDGFQLTDRCDVIQNIRTLDEESKFAVYWRDGVLAVTSSGYTSVGYEGDSSIPMINFTGATVLVRQPAGSCQIPADVFPDPAE